MLAKKRLFASMLALRSGDTVTEAAMKSGFSDYSNFIRSFTASMGVSPGKYKQENNKKTVKK